MSYHKVPLPPAPDLDDAESVWTFTHDMRRFPAWALQRRLDAMHLAWLAHNERVREAALRKHVAICRKQGMSWADIAHVLGISRQGAQARFGGKMR